MILSLKNTELLKTPLERFDFNAAPVDPKELAQAMLKLMHEHQGIGLAANQCGLPYRVFVMKSEPNYVVFNPVIIDSSSEQVVMEEGCLSFPNLIVKVKRPASIKMRYQDVDGNFNTDTFTGMTARCVQHETDHLNGVLFYARANRIHREQAFKNKKLYDRRVKQQAAL